MKALRITAGSSKGRRIPVPSETIRPTSERARQAYFDLVGPRIAGTVFVDLFAGTGIFAFEAVSRGAREAWAIDASTSQVGLITARASEWKLSVRAIRADGSRGLDPLPGSFEVDLVYADPPYDYEGYRALVEHLDRSPRLASRALVAIEFRSRREPFGSAGLQRLEHRKTLRHGEISIALFDLGGTGSAAGSEFGLTAGSRNGKG